MKRLFCVGLFLMLILGAKAINTRIVLIDTIDFYQIKLNGKEVLATRTHNDKTGEFGEAAYILNNLSAKDNLDIIYFTDTPCAKCPSKIELRTRNGIVIKTLEKTFDNSAFHLTGTELKKVLTENAEVYTYFSGKHEDWRPWQLLGVIMMKE